jgi:ATP-binding cassette, subfamily F, member 3
VEFLVGRQPRIFHGNVTYYLEKKAEEEAAAAKMAGASGAGSGRSGSAESADGDKGTGNRKEQRRLEGLKRQEKTRKLKPLQTRLEEVEARISQIETSKAELMAKMGDPSFFTDRDAAKLTAQAFKAAESDLENAYSDWAKVSDELERAEAQFAG